MQTVLIIDDDRIIASIYRTKLRQEGFAAEVAADGEQALTLAARIKPAAILLDLMLPKMSGIEVLKAIRADPTLAETPVVVLSNTHVRGAVGEAWGAGADSVLLKSDITPNQVINAIRQSIATRAARGVPAPQRVGAGNPQTPVDTRTRQAAATRQAGEDAGLWQHFLSHAPSATTLPRQLPPSWDVAPSHPHARVNHWLGGLLADTWSNAALITPAVVRTVTEALAVLSREPTVPPTREHPWLALALHKDAQIRASLRISLEQAGLALVLVSTSEVAFGLVRDDNRLDVILSEPPSIAVLRAALAKSTFPPPPILEVLSIDASARAVPGSLSAASYTLCAPWTSSEAALLVWTALAARLQPD